LEALSIEPKVLAELYVERMKCHQELGMSEHARIDYQKVLVADPNYIRREMMK
jgi:hypothetical protein